MRFSKSRYHRSIRRSGDDAQLVLGGVVRFSYIFRHGLKCYRERRWDEGIKPFTEALILNLADFLSNMISRAANT